MVMFDFVALILEIIVRTNRIYFHVISILKYKFILKLSYKSIYFTFLFLFLFFSNKHISIIYLLGC